MLTNLSATQGYEHHAAADQYIQHGTYTISTGAAGTIDSGNVVTSEVEHDGIQASDSISASYSGSGIQTTLASRDFNHDFSSENDADNGIDSGESHDASSDSYSQRVSDSYPSEGQSASGQDQIETSLVTTAADSQWAAGAGSGTSQSDTTTYSYDDAFSPGYGSSWSSSQTSDPSLSTFATTGNGGQRQYTASAVELVSPHVVVFSVPLSTNVPVVTDTIKVEETVPQQACFVAGTPIVTRDGFKPIEDVRIGDEVACKSDGDPRGELFWRIVDQLFKHDPTPILGIEIEHRLIRGTANHSVLGRHQSPLGQSIRAPRRRPSHRPRRPLAHGDRDRR